MAANRNPVGSDGPKSSWPGYIQFLFVVMVTVIFVLLALSMKRHHFLDGMQDNPIHASKD